MYYLRILLSSFGEEDLKGLAHKTETKFAFFHFKSYAKMSVEFDYNFMKL